MPCVNPDGTLTIIAKRVLAALENPLDETEVAAGAGIPLFQARANLRELIEFELVKEIDGIYHLVKEDEDDIPIPEAF